MTASCISICLLYGCNAAWQVENHSEGSLSIAQTSMLVCLALVNEGYVDCMLQCHN